MRDAIGEAIEEVKDGVVVRVEVSPSSRRIEIKYNEWRKAISVKLRSEAKRGEANRELVEILEKIFDSDVRIVRGERANVKLVKVKLSKKDAVERLERVLRGSAKGEG